MLFFLSLQITHFSVIHKLFMDIWMEKQELFSIFIPPILNFIAWCFQDRFGFSCGSYQNEG